MNSTQNGEKSSTRSLRKSQPAAAYSEKDIAVIGMSARFPGAGNVAEYWRNLHEGIESISFYTPEELASSGIDVSLLNNPQYVKAGSVLEDIEAFDASFFSLSPREAESMDPQQRLFLECAWHALEDAGYDPGAYNRLIGVFAGCAMSTYLSQLQKNPDFMNLVGFLQVLIGNDKDYLPTHVSYKLNLKGPSVSIQTTCSTSLVAICISCQNLLTHQCDMALAGGVCIRVPHKTGYFYEPGGIYSPDGHCRVFDAKAQGVVFGNGVGIVVLKRLSDALADGDCIRAVIKGWAINNDGSAKPSYAAPAVSGQAEVIRRAHAAAGIRPETITYVEAHGTGTVVGDPVEIAALSQAFQQGTRKKNFCAVGSVKTNFGHLDHAAGVAGLIKTVLALEHKMLPPSLNCETLNPSIDFANTPFYVNSALSEWKTGRRPRRAGVSAFGIGGTNAHVILEEAPATKSVRSSRSHHLLVISARTRDALEAATTNLTEHLKQHPEQNLADISYTYQVGRRAFVHRRMLVCEDVADAIGAIEAKDPKRVFTGVRGPARRQIVFMFSGQGTQYVHMAADLYRTEPIFREHVDRCTELLKPSLGFDLRRVLYPRVKLKEAADQLKQTAVTQPALFVIEYALANLWMQWGVRPQAMIGHSIGEYVAACLAGVFSLEDGLRLVAERGRLMQQQPGGSMLAVPLPEHEVQSILGKELCLAAVNEASMCVVSGPTEAVKSFAEQLSADGRECRYLHTSHAFHSWMMDPILQPLTKAIQKINLKPPAIPFISNVSGTWISASEATSAAYWTNHAREPVRFADGVGVLMKDENCVLLEIGPGQALSTFARRHPSKSPEQRVFSSLRHPQERQIDTEFVLMTLGRLWVSGVPIDWSGVHAHERRSRLSVPGYPFERQRYWIKPINASSAPASNHKKADITDWFYVPSWKRSFVPSMLRNDSAKSSRAHTWLIFEDNLGLGHRLVKCLRQTGATAVTVRMGVRYAKTGDRSYEINPRRAEHYVTLLKDLVTSDSAPDKIIHLWTITGNQPRPTGFELFQVYQERGFYSLLWLVQALGKNNITGQVQLGVVSNGLHLVHGDEKLHPPKTTVLGACKSIPQEYPNIHCRSIDVIVPTSSSHGVGTLCDHLVQELGFDSRDTIVAYRGGQRWVQIFEPVPLSSSNGRLGLLRERGVYLITGGLGNIGLALAEDLAHRVRARLILLGRSAFPEHENWEQWLESHEESDLVSRRIHRLQVIESLGSELMVLSADIAAEEDMQRVMDKIYTRFGVLNGVIHGAGTVAPEAFFGIHQATRPLCNLHFKPKAQGLMTLEGVLAGKQLDFWLLLSSLSSILAGLGFGAYSAANNFLNAVACQHNQAGGTPWITVNWDAWELQENWALTAMLPAEGVETFRRILSHSSLQQVAVSISDLPARVDKWINLKSFETEDHPEDQEQAPLHDRPSLEHDYVSPRTEVERAIADIWQELLGVSQVGIHDNFFTELGGHSLLATQMIARLRTKLQIDLSALQSIKTPTVAELAVEVEALRETCGDKSPSSLTPPGGQRETVS
jgi:acyl transferase domain-containing protein